MSAESLVEGLGARIGRRKYLVKLGTGTVGALLALMGLTQTVAASPYCCSLCNSDSGSCSGCACTWCWACCYGDFLFDCCECFSAQQNCGRVCPAICSWTVNRGTGLCNP